MSASAFPSFELVGDNADLRPWVNAINRITDEVILVVTEEGLEVKAVDSANVAMVETTIEPNKFDQYDVQTGQTGVNVSSLLDGLKDVDKRDMVRLEGDGVDSEIRVYDFQANEQVATVPMINPGDVRDPPDIPALDIKTSVQIPGDQFSRLVRVAEDVSDHIVMGVAPSGGRGSDMAFRTLAEGDTDEVIGYPDHEFVEGGPPVDAVGSKYSLEYVNSFRLALDRPASTDVIFRFPGVDFPFFMDFGVGKEPRVSVRYLMAPRIESGASPADALTEWPVDSTALQDVDWKADMDGERAKEMFGAFTTFVDEYKLLINDLGLETRAVDSANVAMSGVEVTPDYFDSLQEVSGYPQRPIGMTGRRVDSLLGKWKQGQDFEFAGDHASRRVSLKHPIFTARLATIDPDSIRSEPDFPALELTATADVLIEDLNETVEDALSVSDHVAFLISDRSVYALGIGEDRTVFGSPNATNVRGRGVSLFSGEYVQEMLDAMPPSAEEAELRLGFEHPAAIQVTPGNGLDVLYLIAPRVQSEGEDRADFSLETQEALDDEPIDLSWLSEGPGGAREAGVRVDAFTGFEKESIEERMRRQRLSTFPIETSISTTGTPGAYETGVRVVGTTTDRGIRGDRKEVDLGVYIHDAEDIAVPDSTFGDVLDEVVTRLRFDALDTGERVAEVTFEDETRFDIDLLNPQPETEHSLSTEDGIRMASISRDDNDYAYASDRMETPAREQIVIRAAADPDGGGYAVFLGVKDPQGSPRGVGQPVTGELPTIATAYAELLDYLETHTIEELVEESDAIKELPNFELADELSLIAEDFVDYTLRQRPGHGGEGTNFYAVLTGDKHILPDAEFRGQIIAEPPETEGGPYPVRYVLSLVASGPASARVERELAANDIGLAERRDDIPDLVREAFEEIRSFGDQYARTTNGRIVDFPSISQKGVQEFSRFFLPAPKDELQAAMEAHGLDLPFKLTDVDQVGPTRAQALNEKGIADMLDVVALMAAPFSNLISGELQDLSEPARENITDAAEMIWEEIVWPRRDAPEGFEVEERDIERETKAEPVEVEVRITPSSGSFSRGDPKILFDPRDIHEQAKRAIRGAVRDRWTDEQLNTVKEQGGGPVIARATVVGERVEDIDLSPGIEAIEMEEEPEEPAEGIEHEGVTAPQEFNGYELVKNNLPEQASFSWKHPELGQLHVSPRTEGGFGVQFNVGRSNNLGSGYSFEGAIELAKMAMDPLNYDGKVPDDALVLYLDRVIGVSRQGAEALAEQFDNYRGVRRARRDRLESISGVGRASVDAIMEFAPGIVRETEEFFVELDRDAGRVNFFLAVEDPSPVNNINDRIRRSVSEALEERDFDLSAFEDGTRVARVEMEVERTAGTVTNFESEPDIELLIEPAEDREPPEDFGRTVEGTFDEEVIEEGELEEEVVEEPEPEPEPRERERREIEAAGGEVRAEPVVRLEGGERQIEIESREVSLDVATRNEIRERIEEEIDIRQVPVGEPLGEVRIAVDGITEVNLERAKELLGEQVEASQRAAEAIDILRE